MYLSGQTIPAGAVSQSVISRGQRRHDPGCPVFINRAPLFGGTFNGKASQTVFEWFWRTKRSILPSSAVV